LTGDSLAYAAPGWLPGGHLQTIWPALFSRRVQGAPVAFTRERRTTPDGDFVDIDWLTGSDALAAAGAPLLVLFHGLEGSSRSHYAQAFAGFARQQGLAYAVPHFRGCSGEINLAPRAYHSGDHEEVSWMLAGIAARHRAQGGGDVVAVGVSLGGNALLRWAEEAGDSAAQTVRAVAAVCSPLDLAAGGAHIGQGLNRQIYTRMFLRTMKPKALAKLAQHPGLFDRARLLAARDLYEFDDVFTGPLHGFAGVDDYWRRASAKPYLASIRIPALALNALNDPFVPAASLPRPGEVGPHVTLWQPAHGGHVGFAGGGWPGHVADMPQSVGRWLLQHVSAVTPRAIAAAGAPGAPQSDHG
jgi:predicted alpha/beta-fold hydrolase